MANIKFSQLPATTSLTGATFPVVQAGNNYIASANLVVQRNAAGDISTTGNITTSGGYISAFGNILTSGRISATGNIQGNVFLGNGSQLTNIVLSGIANGTSNISIATANGNITMSVANVANIVSVSSNTVSMTGTVYLGTTYVEKTAAQTFTAPYTPNIANGTIQTFTANSNFTLNAPTNMSAGQNICLIITQDATGNRVMTANSVYKFAGGINSLSRAGNSIDSMSIFYTGSTYLCTLIKGYA